MEILQPRAARFSTQDGHQLLCQATRARKVFANSAENLPKVSGKVRIKTNPEFRQNNVRPLKHV
jgi:hypothetical protein